MNALQKAQFMVDATAELKNTLEMFTVSAMAVESYKKDLKALTPKTYEVNGGSVVIGSQKKTGKLTTASALEMSEILHHAGFIGIYEADSYTPNCSIRIG